MIDIIRNVGLTPRGSPDPCGQRYFVRRTQLTSIFVEVLASDFVGGARNHRRFRSIRPSLEITAVSMEMTAWNSMYHAMHAQDDKRPFSRATMKRILAFARPRVIADAAGVRIRNVIGGYELPWEVVRGIRFERGNPWVTLELEDDDVVAIMAIQAADKEYAVTAARAVALVVATSDCGSGKSVPSCRVVDVGAFVVHGCLLDVCVVAPEVRASARGVRSAHRRPRDRRRSSRVARVSR